MTGGTVTYLDDVLFLGFQREVFVEGGQAIYLHADAQLLGDQLQNLRTEIFELRLHILHNGNQLVALATIGVNDLLYTI